MQNDAERCHSASGTTTLEPSFHARFLEAIPSPKWSQLKMRHNMKRIRCTIDGEERRVCTFQHFASECWRPIQGQQSVRGLLEVVLVDSCLHWKVSLCNPRLLMESTPETMFEWGFTHMGPLKGC